ncbi:hypothetical protein Acr_27g0005450 [Actinidia rufa]|uniref:Late embryogenesis abundant protein, group 6 n=1 Tax=Actinidia rufa TaxID=165716 RepID=A0A7J0H6T3_9ERIC|nr:hypothetical protein Acr_27g0005450 [Actinidia rufa]
MEKSGQQMRKPEAEQNKEKLEGLPVETSPYTQYKDVEDYKRQGYGTQGHQEPKAGRGGGSTDAPTISGSAGPETKLFPTDVINRHGIP